MAEPIPTISNAESKRSLAVAANTAREGHAE